MNKQWFALTEVACYALAFAALMVSVFVSDAARTDSQLSALLFFAQASFWRSLAHD
jgi:hypothetical protein